MILKKCILFVILYIVHSSAVWLLFWAAPLGGVAVTLTLVLGVEAVAIAAAAAVHKGPTLPRAKVEVPQQDVLAAGAL